MIYVSSWFLLAAIGLSVFGPPIAFVLGRRSNADRYEAGFRDGFDERAARS